jgi:predicted dehydrogenase
VDVVILATPPHFRPMHFDAAIRAGKHVFMEKPCAVDPAGVRRVLDAAREADRKGLCVVAGTQRRHETSYLQAMERIHRGDLGRIVSARCSWNQGGLWMHPRQPSWSDTEWQLRNWLYFTWLSGDHIVEQHVHNLDVIAWALRATPLRCWAMGGRQVRTDPAYGHVFDHFCVEYEFPEGVIVTSTCRQIDGCTPKVDETIEGADASMHMTPGRAELTARDGASARAWSFEGPDNDPYTQEHKDLFDAVRSGEHVNEAEAVAHSTLIAVMGRMAAYSGKSITWEQALNSPLDLSPGSYGFGPLPVPDVAVPGRTPSGV